MGDGVTTRTQLRSVLNAAFPQTNSMRLGDAIKEVRRLQAVDAEYYRQINRSHDGEDEQGMDYGK